MGNSEWRATLRAADIPRRPAPTQRPGEKPIHTTVFPPRRVVIPMAALEQAQNESIAEELGLPLDPAPSSYTPPPTTLAPAPETRPSAPLEATEMAKAKRAKRGRSPHDDEYKIAAVARMLQATRDAMEAGESTRGLLKSAAEEAGISGPSLKGWMAKFRKEAGALGGGSTRTLVSPPSAPMSAAVSVRGPLPPLPTVTLQGLEEYINAIVDRRIKERLAPLLGGG